MELLYYPNPVLAEVARAVEAPTKVTEEAIREMFQIMYATKGIGLAGPQAGLNVRVIVANMTGDPEQKDQEEVYVDPEILEKSAETVEEEACLSLPGLVANIARAKQVKVRYTTLEGRTVTRTVKDLHAVLFQHEIDHLDGILIVDRMQPAEKAKWRATLKELESDFKANRKPRSGNSEAGL